MAFGPTGDATCLRLCARLSIPANARACPHIKPSRRPFRLSALCSNRVEQLRVFVCEGWCIYFVVEDRFALHVLGFKELYLSYLPSLSLFPHRHVRSTVEHGGYFLHRHLMFICHSLEVALYPEDT